jgi:N-methylhydantoinase B
MAIVAPVFADGRLIMWSGAMMHMADIGGMRPGGFAFDATETYQEGLQFPPTKLVEGGVLRQDLWNLILTHSRMAPAMALDLKGLMAANYAAAEGFDKLVRRYGTDTLLAVMAGLIRLSQERLGRRLRQLPDATIEAVGYLEYEPAIGSVPAIILDVTKQGDRLIFDYSRSSPQLPNSRNCTWAGLMAGISSALLPTLAFDIPWNQGLFNQIEVICPEGRVCNARRPAAVSGNISGAVWEVAQTATIGLSRLVACSDEYAVESQSAPCGRPGAFGFMGVNQHGERFTGGTMDVLASGGGAYSHRDGVWTQGHHDIERVNVSNIESLELDLPIMYLWRGLSPNGGGAGRRRGGLSLSGVYMAHKTENLVARSAGPWDVPDAPGAFGGYPGPQNDRILVKDSDLHEHFRRGHVPALAELEGEVVYPTEVDHGGITLGPDDVLCGMSPGPGGWGDPLDRPLDDVQADLAFGAVSPEAVWRLYGVVLDGNGHIDAEATHAARHGIRGERKAWPTLKQLADGPPADGLERVGPLGDQLEVVRDGRGQHWTRCVCGHVLAPGRENWREYAGRNVADPADMGTNVRVHETMEIRRYSCPACGRLHAVDVCYKDAPDPHDIRLALSS